MAVRKFALSLPQDVMDRVSRAAAERGLTRSRFIADVLRVVADARRDQEITRRVNALFADPAVRAEQKATADAFRSGASGQGTEW